jgi:tellurite resistance protein TehA-like permease
MEQEQSIDKLTATWLLPAIASIVCAGTGGNLCTVIPPNSAALPYTFIASYILWGISVPLALSILVLYVYRLTVYKVFSVE